MNRQLIGGLAVAVAALGVAVGAQRGGNRVRLPPGKEFPPGTTETRAASGQAPEFPAPSIVDYHPRSTLVTAEHIVPRSKYPSIDIHGHPPSLTSTESIDRVIAEMDKLNLRVMVSADNSSGDRLTRAIGTISASAHKDRFRVLAGINFNNVGPNWGAGAVAQLEADIKAGAVGVGEVPKSFGLRNRKPDGSRLRIEGPELHPILGAFDRL